MAEKSRKLLMDDIRGWFSGKICPNLSPEKLDDYGSFPDQNDKAVVDEVYKHRWSYQLSSLEKGLMLGQVSMKAYDRETRTELPYE